MYHGEPFTREWISYCFAYIVPFTFLCMVISAICLHYYRVEPKKSKPNVSDAIETDKEDEKVAALSNETSFVPVTLTFKDLSYEVKSSVGGEQIKLLNSVSGVFSPGRMCACRSLFVMHEILLFNRDFCAYFSSLNTTYVEVMGESGTVTVYCIV